MKRAAAVTAAAGALVWFLAGGVPWPSRVMLTLIVAGLPPLGILQAREAERMPTDVPRVALYLSSMAFLWILAAITLAAALASGASLDELGVRAPSVGRMAAWTLGTWLGGLAVVIAFRCLGGAEKRIVRHLVPRTPTEVRVFLALSLTAGVTEELVFRGFLIGVLTTVLGAGWAAAVFAAVVFGLLHAYQGVVGTVRASLLGALLAVPVLVTGSVVPSMAAHAALDAVAGTVLSHWLAAEHPQQAG